MTPFNYPATAHVWRHGPRGYTSVPSFRPWVRDEFTFRCVYCLRREAWEPDASLFQIDHVRPVSRAPELVTVYENLVYSCSVCNLAKRDRLLPDPKTVLTADAVTVEPDGRLTPLTAAANVLILALDLNDPEFVLWRFQLIRIVTLAARRDKELHRNLLAFPADLPDLATLRPPGGNTRPDGVEQSYLGRRERGELPPTY